MKTASILNVLIYLFHHHFHERFDKQDTQQKLLPDLETAGFSRQTIYSAFHWLEQLNHFPLQELQTHSPQAIRIYHEQEQQKLNCECRGYLTNLELCSVLTPSHREKIITLVLALDEEDIDIYLVRWVTLLVLFTQPNNEGTLAFIEQLILREPLTLQ